MKQLELPKSIVAGIRRLEAAEQALVAKIKALQRNCKHEAVWETPWKDLEYAGCLNARRMCCRCRYEEEGSHWSGRSVWSRVDFTESVLGNAKVVIEIRDRDEFYDKRLPVDVPDAYRPEPDDSDEEKPEAA